MFVFWRIVLQDCSLISITPVQDVEESLRVGFNHRRMGYNSEKNLGVGDEVKQGGHTART